MENLWHLAFNLFWHALCNMRSSYQIKAVIASQLSKNSHGFPEKLCLCLAIVSKQVVQVPRGKLSQPQHQIVWCKKNRMILSFNVENGAAPDVQIDV
jgi:hypothetical protein